MEGKTWMKIHRPTGDAISIMKAWRFLFWDPLHFMLTSRVSRVDHA
jgi:hypothetical protein